MKMQQKEVLFSPSIAELTAQINAGDGIGTFSSTYTVGEGTSCQDSAELCYSNWCWSCRRG